ncbi:hypothetical protein Micbo1qcDRAFT_216364 [Microdochium bolleyi]|uniref:SnoaL-like domain-containing protein n=1 Tax=Microdochium bolleyi TaxID=196109 RepID=A0A136IQU8_9PEZI|nr:hypothetical protein Micbo1qcDRAFT_216364 [Microdochium bolleyi]
MKFSVLSITAVLAVTATAAPAPSSCPLNGQLPAHPAPAYAASLPPCPILHSNGVALSRSDIAQVLVSSPHVVPADTTALADMELIRGTISRYAVAIDGRNFPVLDGVFAAGAFANYSEVGSMAGVAQIKTTLEAALAPFALTQHNMGTSVIQLCRQVDTAAAQPPPGGWLLSAVSVTYVLATHYPAPSMGWPGVISPNDIAVVPVMYQDSWVREIGCQGRVAWKIKERYLLYQGLLIGSVPSQKL